ncbi:mercury transporter [Aneurinibacillus sp. Ricciae_BoGa-3]|uniref:mercury transporter n=1 Tax=Aneurinibacillus sp. Ricciae_BoGa-3 TaxID=3022697 RepID=UPI00233FF54D|nr:mercury transporter [Aneurinibacillus sp. Ricciae_BoGa-3]WCK52983.1 mercury transporter [Aneurinibacillus sp. Ricciae_BoGa-3]
MDEKKTNTGWGILGAIAALILPLLCCGGPLLLAGLGASGVGAALSGVVKNWVLGAMFVVMAIAIIAMVTRRKSRKGMDCCTPPLFKNTKKSDCCTPPEMSVNREHDTIQK